MGKIDQNKVLKRTAILVAAEDILLSEGYIHASMDKIAAQAQVAKQTVYRYFPSKEKLFKATLVYMGESIDEDFLVHLEDSNTKRALLKFAKSFIQFHLSEKHLAVFRLLVSEAQNAPEITTSFFDVGSNDADVKLNEFFSERLNIRNSASSVRLWTAMLLNCRSSVLVGRKRPSNKQIEKYAKEATEFLLESIS